MDINRHQLQNSDILKVLKFLDRFLIELTELCVNMVTSYLKFSRSQISRINFSISILYKICESPYLIVNPNIDILLQL
jgi:hypothetical protein